MRDDKIKFPAMQMETNFNPRLSVRDDATYELIKKSLAKFQSTSLCERRPYFVDDEAREIAISIHVSLWETTKPKIKFVMNGNISIHVSLWETTSAGIDYEVRAIISIHVSLWETT